MVKKLAVSADETYDHVFVCFAFGPFPIQIDRYASAQIFAMTNPSHLNSCHQ